MREFVQVAEQVVLADGAHHQEGDVALDGQPLQAAPGGSGVEYLLQQFGQGLRAFATQRLAFLADHGQLQGGDGGNVLDHREPRRAGAPALQRDKEPGGAAGGEHGHGEAAGDGRRGIHRAGKQVWVGDGHTGQQRSPLRGAQVHLVAGQPLQPAEQDGGFQSLGRQPAQGAEDLQLCAETLSGDLLDGCRDLLCDGDEGHGERDFEDGHPPFLRRPEEGGVQGRHVELGGERQHGHAGVVEALQVGALAG